jgi:hypothetical protein
MADALRPCSETVCYLESPDAIEAFLGTPAMTAIAFGIGILILPYARETKGKGLPD